MLWHDLPMEERLGNHRSFQCSSVKDPLLALRCSERLIRDYCSLLLRQQLSYRKIQSKAMRDWRTQWRCIEMQVSATCMCTRSWTQNLLYHKKKPSGSFITNLTHICSGFIRHDPSSLKTKKRLQCFTACTHLSRRLSPFCGRVWQSLALAGSLE